MTSVAGSVEPVEKEVKVKESATLPAAKPVGPVEEPKDLPKVPVKPTRTKKIPIVDAAAEANKPVRVPVPQRARSRDFKDLSYDVKPLVLSTHLVPSLPVELFEIVAGIIESATNTPVVLLHESRTGRPVATDVVDIALLPPGKEWKEGHLLPVSFVFEHRLNKDSDPGVYADIVVAQDVAHNVEDILDLRGHRVALPDRYTNIGAAGLLFNHLHSKGENPSFFGNTLDSGSQVAALQMVAGKQTEVGILEAPVINCHKHSLPGVHALLILDSLGPLPPYQILFNSKLSQKIAHDVKKGLLAVNSSPQWLDRLQHFGIVGFAEYSKDNYDVEDIKSVVTSVPYY